MQPNIRKSIEDTINQRTELGPSLIDGYRSSLESAAGQDQQSIDALRGIYNDPSKFERSKLGAFGLGLMKPTSSGNFGEGMYNALSAAVDTKNYNQEQALGREEKLAKLASVQAALTRQQANDQMSVYDKQSSWMQGAQSDASTMADLQLQGAQYGPRPLAPGEFGPQAPGSDMLSKSMKLYNDYLTNPQNYSGPQGQKMVADAIDILKNERTNASRENVAATRAASGQNAGPGQKALDREFGKDLAEWYGAGGEADIQKQISQLRAAKMKLESGAGDISGWFVGNMPDSFNSMVNPEAINVRDQIAEVTQRNLRAVLGGQFAQKEGDALIARAFNPALDEATNAKRVNALLTQIEEAYRVKQEAIAYFEANGTLSGFSKKLPTMADMEEAVDRADSAAGPLVPAGDVPNTPPAPQVQLSVNPDLISDEDRAWAQEQIDGGANPDDVIDWLNEQYGNSGGQ